MTLVIELKADDVMIINGAPLRFRNNTRVELNGYARFLFGKQIMPPGADRTPARRIYYAIQTAYIGSEEERVPAREAARRFCEEFAQHTTSGMAVQLLDEAMRAVDADRCHDALKLVRRVMRHEDAMLGAAMAGAGEAAA